MLILAVKRHSFKAQTGGWEQRWRGGGKSEKEHISFQSNRLKTFFLCLKDAQKKHSEEKYNTFMKVCDNFQPVFRYFCMEKFRDPAVWFEKRLAYTRSVATSSIGITLIY